MCSIFPGINLDRLQLAFKVDPVNNDSGVTKNPKVIQRPKRGESEGSPQTQELRLSIRSLATIQKPLSNFVWKSFEEAPRPTTKSRCSSSTVKTGQRVTSRQRNLAHQRRRRDHRGLLPGKRGPNPVNNRHYQGGKVFKDHFIPLSPDLPAGVSSQAR